MTTYNTIIFHLNESLIACNFLHYDLLISKGYTNEFFKITIVERTIEISNFEQAELNLLKSEIKNRIDSILEVKLAINLNINGISFEIMAYKNSYLPACKPFFYIGLYYIGNIILFIISIIIMVNS